MKNKNRLSEQLASKEILQQNDQAFKAFYLYKKASEIIERAYIASGKRVQYKSANISTLLCKINSHGVTSTQKI